MDLQKLKDLELPCEINGGCNCHSGNIKLEDAKMLGIQWINRLKLANSPLCGRDCEHIVSYRFEEAMTALKYIFDITEEDLK